MPRKKKDAAKSPSQAWQNTLPVRQRLERYPYTEADGAWARVLCEEMEFWRCDVADELLHDLFLMCEAAKENKSDLEPLSVWLECVFLEIRNVHATEDCNCEYAYGNSNTCACDSRVNMPNEKNNASARLTLLQVLGLICPTAGFIMSKDAVLQELLITKDENPNAWNCDYLSTVFVMVKMKGSLGMGFVDNNQVRVVNVDLMTVRARVSYLMIDGKQFQQSRAVRMTLNLAASMGEARQLPQILREVLHHVQDDIRQREEQLSNGEYLMQNPGVDTSKMLWFRTRTEPDEHWVQLQNMTHLLALLSDANFILNSWDVSGCNPGSEQREDVMLGRPILKPIAARPVLFLHYGMDPRWLAKMPIQKQISVLNMSTAYSLLTAKNVQGDGNCLFHALWQTWQSCNAGQTTLWQNAIALRKAIVVEMRQAPSQEQGHDLMSGYSADTWRSMCDEFEKDGVWADHSMLPFASKVLDMAIEIMPALPNPEGSDHLKFTHGLSEVKQHMSCVVGWLNGSHYTMTAPMQEKVQLRSQLEFTTVLFQYDSACAQLK